jgi:nifR3 family TIM-barrel protein
MPLAEKPLVALAPMDGYTDSAFRRLVKRICPSALVYSEMISADAVIHLSAKTAARLSSRPDEFPLVVQLFGTEPEKFAKAAKILAETRAAGVDLNAGCSVASALRSGHGGFLTRKPKLVAEIVAALRENFPRKVSVKTRLGFEDPSDLPELAHAIEKAGADFLAVHGRTVKQGFAGAADWEPIRQLAEEIEMPIFGNGDLDGEPAAREKISKSRIAGVLIGRATFGNPFLFADFSKENGWGDAREFFKKSPAASSAEENFPSLPPLSSSNPPFAERVPWLLLHARLAVEEKGERLATLELRKHLAKAVAGVPGAARFRERLVRVESLEQIEVILEEAAWEN